MNESRPDFQIMRRRCPLDREMHPHGEESCDGYGGRQATEAPALCAGLPVINQSGCCPLTVRFYSLGRAGD
jgi:hypothetical protein